MRFGPGGHSSAIAYSIALHAAVVLAFTLDVDLWRTRAGAPEQPAAIKASVVDAAVLEEAEAERQAERERQRREAERQAELERQRQEAERQAELERQRQEAERQAELERQRKAAQQARREAELQQQLAAEAEAREARDAGLLDQYIGDIQNAIRLNWIRPGSAQAGIECVVHVTQIPSGDVVDVSIGRCNGDAAVERSIERAVLRASPLPKPPVPQLFERNLDIIFSPDD